MTGGFGENYEQTQEERQTKAPQRLSKLRPRALTLDSDLVGEHTSFLRSQTCDQSQSILFAQLARELRQLIWTDVLGGHLLHIARAPNRLVAIACADNRGQKRHVCWGLTYRLQEMAPTPGFYFTHGVRCPARPANLLPLLQTCRRIYMETILIPYTDNKFDINHIDTLVYLQRSILPQRLTHIRVLSLTWNFKRFPAIGPVPYDLGTWREACKVLADNFTGLHQLSINIRGDGMFGGQGPPYKDRWGPLLEALLPIKAQKFELFLPFSEADCVEAAKKEHPFRLVSNYDWF